MNFSDLLFPSSSTLFPSYKNPANAAMPYLQQIPDMEKGYYQPFITAGNNALNDYSSQMRNLATPQGAMNNYNTLAAGYSQSPGTQFAIDNANKATNQYAAAGGMAGSPSEQQAIANETVELSDEDFNNYMKMVTGEQNTGFTGENDVMRQGYSASNSLAQELAKNLSEQGAYGYAGVRNQNANNAANSKEWWSIMGDAAGIGASLAPLLLM